MEHATITLDRNQLYHIYDESMREYLRIVRMDANDSTIALRDRMHEKYEIAMSIEKQVPFVKEIWMSMNHARREGDSIKLSGLIKKLVDWFYGKN